MAEARGEVTFEGVAVTDGREVYTMAGERVYPPPAPPAMSRPVHGTTLRFKVKAAPSGAGSSVVMVTEFGEYDISMWVREMSVYSSVDRATEMTLTFIGIDVEMEAEPESVSSDGAVPVELASILLPLHPSPTDGDEEED